MKTTRLLVLTNQGRIHVPMPKRVYVCRLVPAQETRETRDTRSGQKTQTRAGVHNGIRTLRTTLSPNYNERILQTCSFSTKYN